MPRFRAVPEKDRQAIAAGIGRKLSRLEPALLGAAPPQLEESVDVWAIGAEQLASDTFAVEALARPTGRWHHQVSSGGAPTMFASSLGAGDAPESWHVVSVAESPLAERFRDAVAAVDGLEGVPEAAEARLLVVPAYKIFALWIRVPPDDRVCIVDAPEGYGQALQPGRVMGGGVFLKRVRELRRIEGITG